MAKWSLIRDYIDENEDYSVLILDNENNRGEYYGWCGYGKIRVPLGVVKGPVYRTVINEKLLVISTKEVDVANSTTNIISFVDGEMLYLDPGFWIEYVHSKECSDLYRATFLNNEYPEIEGYISRAEYDSEDEYQSEWWDAIHEKYDSETEDADELLQLNDILDEVKIILE